MALGAVREVIGTPHKTFDTVAPVSLTSGWVTVIDAGGMTVQDAATITDPTAEITNSTRHILRRNGVGTTLLVRMAYDDGITSITNPVIKVFGRTPDQQWQLLKTRAGALNATITTAVATDCSDGTLNWTTSDYDAQAWDCLGCGEILIGIETALAATGTTSTAYLEAKFI